MIYLDRFSEDRRFMLSWDKVKNCFKDICQHKVLSLIISIGVIAVIFFIICIFDHDLLFKCKIFIMKDKFKNFIELIKGVGWIIGGSIGLIILEDKFNLADKTHALEKEKEANQKQIADQNHKLELKKEVNQRFAKAVELLGNENEATRIGALYTLEQILKEDGSYYDSCMDIIAGYVRYYSVSDRMQNDEFKKWQKEKDSNYNSPPERKLTEDIITAVNILSRNSTEENQIDLKSIDWSGVDLSKTSIKFKNIDFSYSQFIEIDLMSKCFSNCDLFGVNLKKANLSFSYLKGIILINANLAGVNLSKTILEDAYLEAAYLEGTYLEGATINQSAFEKEKEINEFYDFNLIDKDKDLGKLVKKPDQ
jgi:hypothetical protein